MTDTENESWVEKYRPQHFGEIQGNTKAVKALKDWADDWQMGDQGQLIYGEPGTGKTSTAYVISQKLGYPLNQINASDSRSSERLKQIAQQIQSTPPDAKHQLVLIDEVDSQHHATNKRPLYEALKNPKNPVILTANDLYSVPSGIKNKVKQHEFKLQKRSRASKLKKICKAEGLEFTDEDIDDLAERPDLRSAINDLQNWAETGVPPGDDEREWTPSEFEVLDDILRGKKDSGQMNPKDLILWLDENVSMEYRGVEAAMAYEALSMADLWHARAQREDYRYWKYAGELAESVASLRLTEPYDGWMDKNFPEWFRHSQTKPTSKAPEAGIYRKMKKYEDGVYQFAGDFTYFSRIVIPILEELPLEERLELALNYDLTGKEMQVIDVTKKQFKGWSEQDVPPERHKSETELNQTSAMEW